MWWSGSRRRFLSQASSFAALAAVPSALAGVGDAGVKRDEDALDDALRSLGDTGPEYSSIQLANHGPMAVEALVALGQPDAVGRWVAEYRGRLGGRPPTKQPITDTTWLEALGDFARAGDWFAFFDRQLKDAPWAAVVREWTPRLAPGLVGAATHGIIRASHAVRALALKDGPARRRELADGLAYWAARFCRLPEAETTARAKPRGLPSGVLSDVPALPSARRRGGGLITDRLLALEGFAEFRPVADLADTSGDPRAFLSDLTRTFARVYLDQAPNRGVVISFIHAVTGPAAVRRLLPHVAPETAAPLLRYAWQAAAGLYSAMAQPMKERPAEPADASELIALAVRNGDEHAIKFTEVCLAEHQTGPDPIYLAAARDAIARL